MKALEYLLSQPLMVTHEALEAAVAIVTRNGVIESVDANRGQRVDGSETGMRRRGATAVIPVLGPIFRYADFFTQMCGGATVEGIARDLNAAVNDRAVESIVLNIDSPGGEAAGISELAGMIHEASNRKPVVAYVGHMGASAAYFLASAASEIVAAEWSLLGSIGVVMGWTKRGDHGSTKSYEFVSSQSPNKRPDPETERGRAEIQRVVDDLGQLFVEAVAKYRDVSTETVLEKFGAGGVLVGQKAVDAGMADRLGTFEGVLAELSAQAAADQRVVFPLAAAGREGTAMFGFRLKPSADGAVDIHAIEPQGKVIQGETLEMIEAVAEPLRPVVDAAKEKELADLRQQLADARLETIKATANGWYGSLFAANKVVPAEKDAAVAARVRAALDDLAHPLADGATRVSLVEAMYGARTAHTLDREQIDSAGKAPKSLALLKRDNGDDDVEAQAMAGLKYLVNSGSLPADVLKG